MYFLGIDAGGTKCNARLTDASGRVIGQGMSGPANANTGVSNVFDTIQAAYQQAVAQAGLGMQEIASIRAGIGICWYWQGRHKREVASTSISVPVNHYT